MKKKNVFVGLSGGVDSALSAALLQEQGYDVTGVFIRTWHPEGFPCSEGEDEREAMRVAAHLSIPFRTLDLASRYKKEVAEYMIAAYARGETPNPDVLCNREVKFGGFVQYAKDAGADAVATGHYARLQQTEDGPVLSRAADTEKDQSYFLSLVPDEALAYALFPLGSMHKSQVRAEAAKRKLPNATRKDSQGICFLGALNLQDFLSAYIPLSPGEVLAESGEVIGTHDGSILYTTGERHGFQVPAHATNAAPLYVLSKDHEKNTITVGPKDHIPGVLSVSLRAVQKHHTWGEIRGELEAQVRYHGELHAVERVSEENGVYVVAFKKPVSVAAGQTVALYTKEGILVLAGEAMHRKLSA